METESRLMLLCAEAGEEGMGGVIAKGYGFLFEMMKMFQNCGNGYLSVNILKTTQFYALNR